MVKHIALISVSVAAISCNQLDVKGLFIPTGESVEKRFEQSSKMNEGLKSSCVEVRDSYTFYVAADPHINQTHNNLGRFNDSLKNNENASFGVILGDCIDVKDNMPKYLEALACNPEEHKYNQPIYHVLGNHDTYFNGWVDYREHVGASVYWFEAVFEGGKDLYIALDTANGSLGRKQTQWFKSFLEANRKDYRHCVILTHTNFFYTDNSQAGSGNMPFEESLALIDFLGKQNVSLVLQGHDHYKEDLTYGNVRYTVLSAIHDSVASPEYLIINVSKDGLELKWQTVPTHVAVLPI